MTGGTHCVRLTAVRPGNGDHLIIALKNIDDKAKSHEAMKSVSGRSAYRANQRTACRSWVRKGTSV